MSGIGELNESSLHAQLKEWYTRPGDEVEVNLDGYFIDIVRGEQLIEIQTGNFSKIKTKLAKLLLQHPVRLVYPVASQKWLRKLPEQEGGQVRERKSPKRGRVLDVFREMVYISHLVNEPGFEVEVLLINEREVRERRENKRWRRNGWATVERQLIDVVDQKVFNTARDFACMLPEELPADFTTRDLKDCLQISTRLAGQIAYSLRAMGTIDQIGKRGRAYLYKIN